MVSYFFKKSLQTKLKKIFSSLHFVFDCAIVPIISTFTVYNGYASEPWSTTSSTEAVTTNSLGKFSIGKYSFYLTEV